MFLLLTARNLNEWFSLYYPLKSIMFLLKSNNKNKLMIMILLIKKKIKYPNFGQVNKPMGFKYPTKHHYLCAIACIRSNRQIKFGCPFLQPPKIRIFKFCIGQSFVNCLCTNVHQVQLFVYYILYYKKLFAFLFK